MGGFTGTWDGPVREVLGGGDQRLEDLQGRGQPIPHPSAFDPEKEVVTCEPPLHLCVDLDAACCVFIGHDRAREVIVVADEQVPASEGLIVHREFGALELTLVPDFTVPEDSGQRRHGVGEVDDADEEVAKGVSLRAVVTEEYVVVLEGGDGPAVESAVYDVARPAPATETERVAVPVMRQVSTIVFVLQAMAGCKSPGLGVVLGFWRGRKRGHGWVASKLVASDSW
jgi:hypothetical protein